MDAVAATDLQGLIFDRPGPYVSLYCPVHPGGQEDVIRWKTLLRTVRERLDAAGTTSRAAEELLHPAARLLDDTQFWQGAGAGLACFLAPGFTRRYRLGLGWPEQATVGRVFDVRPVLPALASHHRYYVLALSQNAVRLLRCMADGPMPVQLPGPANREEALRAHDTDEMSFAHTFTGAAGGRRQAAFHGHGVGKDDAKDDLFLYFRAVDRALHPVLQGERAPLVVAAVDYLLPVFRQACAYPHLLPAGLAGNPDRRSDRDLADAARPLVAAAGEDRRDAAAALYRQLAGTGRTTDDVGQVVAAAHRGDVEAIYLALGRDIWGRFVPEGGACEVHATPRPGDDELTNLAAVFALRHGRQVHLFPPDKMPTGAALAAVFPLPLAKHGKRR